MEGLIMQKTYSGSFPKKEVLKHWHNLETNLKLNPEPVEYKHTGSTIAEDGIRITGSLIFIDSVLSQLKDLLQYENGETRLQIAWSELTDKNTGEKIKDRYRCSIQVHDRGNEAKIMNRIVNIRTKGQVSFI